MESRRDDMDSKPDPQENQPLMKGGGCEESAKRADRKRLVPAAARERTASLGRTPESAVKSFQKAAGLAVDGKAGKNTIAALGGKWLVAG